MHCLVDEGLERHAWSLGALGRGSLDLLKLLVVLFQMCLARDWFNALLASGAHMLRLYMRLARSIVLPHRAGPPPTHTHLTIRRLICNDAVLVRK